MSRSVSEPAAVAPGTRNPAADLHDSTAGVLRSVAAAARPGTSPAPPADRPAVDDPGVLHRASRPVTVVTVGSGQGD